MFELKADAYFDSAHFLSDYFGKCENIHGHRWHIEATIAIDELQTDGNESGMVMDFSRYKKIIKTIAEELDHTFLVEEGTLSDATLSCLKADGHDVLILPFRTTAENLAKYIFEKCVEANLPIISVEVDETPNNRAIYRCTK